MTVSELIDALALTATMTILAVIAFDLARMAILPVAMKWRHARLAKKEHAKERKRDA